MKGLDTNKPANRRNPSESVIRDTSGTLDLVSDARKLTRLIHKSSSEWSADDLLDFCQDNEIRLVSLMHIGGDGWMKTLDFVPRDAAHFRRILQGGERADGSSLFSGSGIPVGKSDIVLRPRIESAFLDPFADSPVLAVMCSHIDRDGRALKESPDTILRKAYARLEAEAGIALHAHGEIEFYLGKRPDGADVYGTDEHGYHASSPFVFGEALRREALLVLADMGVPIKYGHSEVGYISPGTHNDQLWEQHEIELSLQPLPEAAESVALTQWVLRNLAQQRGFRCSFAPILFKGHAGNGMHFHFAPYRNGNVIAPIDHRDNLSEPAQWLIGGLARYGGMLMAFGNRADTSLTRLMQAKEAPDAVTWGRSNRKALVRLPIVACDEGGNEIAPPTVEFRLADGSAHPYLLLAGIAQAMNAARAMPDLDTWIKNTAENSKGHPHAPTIPTSVAEVRDTLRQGRAMLEAGDVFPADLIDQMVKTSN